jgi:hypothetical protein
LTRGSFGRSVNQSCASRKSFTRSRAKGASWVHLRPLCALRGVICGASGAIPPMLPGIRRDPK